MFKRKGRLLAGALCAVMTALLIVPAAAHGCHGGRGHHGGYRQSAQAAVAVCPYEDCQLAGRHDHDGTIYCGYAHESGYCSGACLALCPYEDCQLVGPHTHDGVTYCGYCHEAGFCEGGCRAGSHGCRRLA